MISPEDFIPCACLADELIGKATKEQLAGVVRLLALEIGYYQEKCGDVPQGGTARDGQGGDAE